MKQAKYPLSLLAAFLIPLLPALHADPDTSRPTPPVNLIQARVFRNLNLQDFKLNGVLHTKKNIYPMVMKTRLREMVYAFTEQPLQIRVVLDPDHATIERRKKESDAWQTVSGKALGETILDTDITYEDLGLGFIFWDKVTGIGCDSIKTLPAWCLEATPPEGVSSSYSKVRYWISSQYCAFLRVDGYNTKGEVIKRVEVNGVMQIGDAYVIREMAVSTMLPGREISASRTFIEIRNGAPGSGL
ncbi:outer membrane lipoprotein-sorting protein [Verrucomicrobium sp. GAS474]|uniref:outer membrane lipoprotein-sorting protein n=1 Tax=Verrucomicrobium sp. GAS474 TaxID=1882831 RepID=UPI00087A998F|nr:outer membrane lipoprotein-sorting protein [Verrucomicrobium sp. GAS474]SDT86658.1 outer membrane lipoprotein-sorting protein [Verrucomicrobium sp. GAS474]